MNILNDILHQCAFLTNKRGTGLDCAAEEANLARLCGHAAANNILPANEARRKMADILFPAVLGGEGVVPTEVSEYLGMLTSPKEVERKLRQHQPPADPKAAS